MPLARIPLAVVVNGVSLGSPTPTFPLLRVEIRLPARRLPSLWLQLVDVPVVLEMTRRRLVSSPP